MHPKFLVFLAVIAGFIIQYSCSKDSSVETVTMDQLAIVTDDVDEAMAVEEILDEVILDLEKYDFLKSAETCPAVSIERPEGEKYPKIVTKDFGDGCETDGGAVKSGKIIITLYGPWLKEGSKRIVTFENYTHRGIGIEGEKEIVCQGETEEGFYEHSIEGTIQLKKSDSLQVKRKIHKSRLLIAGAKDKDIPKEWLVSGRVRVLKSNGVTYVMKIAEPLHHIQGCKWAQSGLKVITFSGDEENDEETGPKVYIDYAYAESDKSCDRYALRWVDDGEAEVIKLKR